LQEQLKSFQIPSGLLAPLKQKYNTTQLTHRTDRHQTVLTDFC